MILNALICIALCLLAYKLFGRPKNIDRHPPQVPWKLPILGHLPYLGSFPNKKLLKWKKQYGPMYLMNMGSFRTLVISDSQILKEASKSVFSDRPPLPTFITSTHKKGILLADYNGGEQRSFFLKQIRIFNEKGSIVEQQVNEALSGVLDSFGKQQGRPVSIAGAFMTVAVNSVWGIVMGSQLSDKDPDLGKLISYTNRMAKIPGILAKVGNFMPWLANLLPGITGVTGFAECYENLMKFTQQKIEKERSTFVEGQPRHFLDAYLDLMYETTNPNSTFSQSRNFLPNTFCDIFIAALETTSSTIEWIVFLLAAFPQVQKKLQDEVVRNGGDSTHSSVQSRPNMPYTEAVIAEVFRWTSLIPMAIPHFSKETAELGGYIIPKDTMLIPNVYGIHHDPEIWGDPEEFRPERFLDVDGQFKKSEHLVIFGFGRRLCLGESIAKDLLFIVTSRLYHRFDVSFGESKYSLDVSSFGFVLHPKPFKVIFRERF